MSTENPKQARNKKQLTEKILIPKEVQLTLDQNTVKLKGQQGEVEKTFPHPKITLQMQGKELLLSVTAPTKREKRMAGTFKSHIKNMLRGVQQGHSYTMKICSGHFPMNVSVANNEFVVQNFLGEKYPRKASFPTNVQVKVEGDRVVITSLDKEAAGQTAAKIEQLTRIKGRDKRIFQDGIYIINKDGKELG